MRSKKSPLNPCVVSKLKEEEGESMNEVRQELIETEGILLVVKKEEE
jgi:hypothetical protein